MKILKIFGIVVGLHAVVLIMIFANPGCSSGASADNRPTPADTAPPSTSSGPAAAPMVTLPGATAAPSPEPAEGAPAGSDANAAAGPVAAEPSATVVFAPTRPDTPAAAALESQPVGGVTPVTTYVVGNGDSLWSIAKRNHVKVSAIAHANHISASAPLHLGQKLIIPGAPASVPLGGTPARASAPFSYSEPVRSESATPAGTAVTSSGTLTYRVRPGDTLGGIARRFHVSRANLGAANSIADPQTIRPGQVLVIPSKGRMAHASAPAAGPAPVPAAGPGVATPALSDSGQDLDAGLTGPAKTIKLDDTGTQSGQGGQQ